MESIIIMDFWVKYCHFGRADRLRRTVKLPNYSFIIPSRVSTNIRFSHERIFAILDLHERIFANIRHFTNIFVNTRVSHIREYIREYSRIFANIREYSRIYSRIFVNIHEYSRISVNKQHCG